MSLQNFSLPYSSSGYFGGGVVVATAAESAASASTFLYNEAVNAAVPPTQYDYRNEEQRAARKTYQPQNPYSEQLTHYTRVSSDGTDTRHGKSSKTSVHAIVDYDDDFGGDGGGDPEYDEKNRYNDVRNTIKHYSLPTVTPIQGPIFIKNDSVPVVPLYSYPKVNNGTFVQIPIMWAALSIALGYEIRGDIIRGAPCIKRHHQLFCPTAGSSYPIDRIQKFIDDNKALMRRMYGEFDTSNVDYGPAWSERPKSKRNHNYPPYSQSSSSSTFGESYFSRILAKRQTLPKTPESESGRVDSCESKLEVVTPFWASNSAGKVRAIVNTQHFEQAIHQEVCSKSDTRRCSNDCRCEQKYKWHRLLAYDPDNDCKGIFMDWFLFPSCCVCRCTPTSK